MEKRGKVLVLLLSFLLLLSSKAFAYWEKPVVRYTQSFRYEDRREHRQLYVHRLGVSYSYYNVEDKPLFKLEPFLEVRRNIKDDLWERKNAGVEIGKDIFPWLYAGEAFQWMWIKEDYRSYRSFEKRDYGQADTVLTFSNKVIGDLKWYFTNIYSYDLNKGAGLCNEFAVGLKMPLGEHFEPALGWRHVDHVGNYDMDFMEVSLTAVF